MIKYLQYLYLILACIFAATVHEYTKAAASAKQGDPTPKKKNRLTLDPRVHFEPVGFICMVISGGYGWGQPVDTSSTYYRDRKKGTLITYILPSLVNLILGVMFAMLSYFCVFALKNSHGNISLLINLHSCAFIFASVNIKLAFFNIIPIYPLDGSKILSVTMSPANIVKYSRNEKLFQILLMFLLLSGMADTVISPFASLILNFARISL